MFDSDFAYRKINYHSSCVGDLKTVCHNFSFKGKDKRYIVIAEQFDYQVYAVKYYLQEHKYCVHKFRRLTKQNECTKVIATVAAIMLELLKKNPYASFTFIGSPSEKEAKNETKRYKIYAKFIENKFTALSFAHYFSLPHSAYLMLNRNNLELQLLEKIEAMFDPVYALLEN